MSARYQVRVSHELTEAWDTSRLPAGLRIAETGPWDPATGCHLVTFDDDEAPEGLNGGLVSLILRANADGTVSVTGRELQP